MKRLVLLLAILALGCSNSPRGKDKLTNKVFINILDGPPKEYYILVQHKNGGRVWRWDEFPNGEEIRLVASNYNIKAISHTSGDVYLGEVSMESSYQYHDKDEIYKVLLKKATVYIPEPSNDSKTP